MKASRFTMPMGVALLIAGSVFAGAEGVEGASSDATVLAAIINPPSKIASANVLDANGQAIGAVQRVEVTPQGRPTHVTVVLIGRDEKRVVLDADAVKYDPSRNEILTVETGDRLRTQSPT